MKEESSHIGISHVLIEGDEYYKISNCDGLRPFFMNVVSDANHWMFVSSNGGLSMGRKDAENALFPYYTDDKITESVEITGSKTIFQIKKEDGSYVWEPFSERCDGKFQVTRNLYKNIYGNKILFEEINHDLELTFSYSWNTSNLFGFVKRSSITNNAPGKAQVSILDGIQNIMPYGANSDLQNGVSNLVDAYKRSELIEKSGLGIFSLSAIIVDKAEPSEALKANIVWSLGLQEPKHLLSSLQLRNFRNGRAVQEESNVKGEKGAYFVNSDLTLQGAEAQEWMIISDVNQNHSGVFEISDRILTDKELGQLVKEDIQLGTKNLVNLNASSDALQLTSDHLRDVRHFSNTLFNIMRGGIFDYNYQIEKWDLKNYLLKAIRTYLKNTVIR